MLVYQRVNHRYGLCMALLKNTIWVIELLYIYIMWGPQTIAKLVNVIPKNYGLKK